MKYEIWDFTVFFMCYFLYPCLGSHFLGISGRKINLFRLHYGLNTSNVGGSIFLGLGDNSFEFFSKNLGDKNSKWRGWFKIHHMLMCWWLFSKELHVIAWTFARYRRRDFGLFSVHKSKKLHNRHHAFWINIICFPLQWSAKCGWI